MLGTCTWFHTRSDIGVGSRETVSGCGGGACFSFAHDAVVCVCCAWTGERLTLDRRRGGQRRHRRRRRRRRRAPVAVVSAVSVVYRVDGAGGRGGVSVTRRGSDAVSQVSAGTEGGASPSVPRTADARTAAHPGQGYGSTDSPPRWQPQLDSSRFVFKRRPSPTHRLLHRTHHHGFIT